MIDSAQKIESMTSLPRKDAERQARPVGVRAKLFGRWLWRASAFLGPGYLVSAGYMDPGNWVTDLSGGSRFGYQLLFIVLLSNLMAIVLQALAIRLGIASDMDLAQACRARYHPWVTRALWLVCEIAIIACDLAEVIGTAIALNLLFHLPILIGTLITVCDVTLLLLLQCGMRVLEGFIITLILVIFACFSLQIALIHPEFSALMHGFIPQRALFSNPDALYLAIGIIGATVMPHNLYLHSSIVQSRAYPRTPRGRTVALRWSTTDSTIALFFAFFINAAILIVSAAVFHANGLFGIDQIAQAHQLLTPLLGASLASTLFAVALLLSGLNSTITATMAGEIVMNGFLHIRLPLWARRLLTRGIAIVPVVIVTWYYGEAGIDRLLIFSQVILSFQLPFAIIPLLCCISDSKVMGGLVAPRRLRVMAWGIATLIIGLNLWLIVSFWRT